MNTTPARMTGDTERPLEPMCRWVDRLGQIAAAWTWVGYEADLIACLKTERLTAGGMHCAGCGAPIWGSALPAGHLGVVLAPRGGCTSAGPAPANDNIYREDRLGEVRRPPRGLPAPSVAPRWSIEH